MKHSLFFLSTLLLSACTVGPDYERPPQSFLERWFIHSEGEAAAPQTEAIRTDWWTVFDDPQLEGYIETAASENNEIKAAYANVRRARALRQEAVAPLFPTLDADFGRTRQGTTDTTTSTFAGGFDASWEIDIFGGTRRAGEAAQARLEGAENDRHAVLLSTLSEVARNYYEVRGTQKRIDIFEQNIALQDQTFTLVDTLFQMGEASEFDLSRARGQLELTRSRLPDLEAEMKAGIYRLSVLLGKSPEALLAEMQTTKPLPIPPDVVPLGLRSDILRRRPDVRAAERELAASTADIGVAIADLYPRFNLTGGVGRSAGVFSDLFSSAANTFSIGQFFQWPVFQGGAIRANIKVQEAEAERAAALYEQTVLDSLADAETALTRYAQKLKTRDRLQNAVEQRTRSVELARALFNAGEEDFLSVIDAERELTSTEDELVISETDTVLNLISLYATLGGGWELFDSSDVYDESN